MNSNQMIDFLNSPYTLHFMAGAVFGEIVILIMVIIKAIKEHHE